MKKLLILISLVVMFAMTSCEKTINDTTINNNQNNTTESKTNEEPPTDKVIDIDDSSKDKVDETNPTVDNTPVDNKTVEPTKDNDGNPSTDSQDTEEQPSESSKDKEESSGSGSVYDDGIDWGPLHQ